MTDSVIESCQGLKSALQQPSNEPPLPTAENMIVTDINNLPYGVAAVDDIFEQPKTTAKKRGRPAGKKTPKTPPSGDFLGVAPDDMEMTKRMVEHGQVVASNTPRAVLLRKKINKYFQHFPKLHEYFHHKPHTGNMTEMQLADLENTICDVLDEGDEAYYVKQAFITTAGFIEVAGPVIHRRFCRWIPNSGFLQHQDGLKEAITQLVDVPGDEGLGDEVNRVAIAFTGYAPNNPYVKCATKIVKIMQAVAEARHSMILQHQSSTDNKQFTDL